MVERLKNGDWIDSYHKAGQLIGPLPKDLGVYVLSDYEFGYTLDAEPFGDQGSAANIEPKAGSKVYGALYQITDEQLRILDKTEDEPIAYTRTALKVRRLALPDIFQLPLDVSEKSLDEITAWVYVGNSKFLTREKCPDPEYAHVIIEAAKKRCLPKGYIDKVLTDRAFATCSN